MSTEQPTMTVQQLIDALAAIEDKTREVITEGCDCNGDLGSVEVYGSYVYLNRTVTIYDDDDD